MQESTIAAIAVAVALICQIVLQVMARLQVKEQSDKLSVIHDTTKKDLRETAKNSDKLDVIHDLTNTEFQAIKDELTAAKAEIVELKKAAGQ